MMKTTTNSTIVIVPCFSGAPWNLQQLSPLAHSPLRTMRLPEALDDIERYADFVGEQVSDLNKYVLVGDSFGLVYKHLFHRRLDFTTGGSPCCKYIGLKAC